MKKHEKFNEVIEIKDLNKSQEKIVHSVTLTEIQGNGTIDRIYDKGIITEVDKVIFLNLQNPALPKIISSSNLKQDTSGYVNTFLGIHNNCAFINTGYIGLQIINVADFQKPQYLGLFKDYGLTLKMAFSNNRAINQSGIFDISDLNNPKILKKYDVQVFDFIVKENSLVYSSSSELGSFIELMKLDEGNKFRISSTLKHNFIYGDSVLKDIGSDYLLAASGNGIGIIEIKAPYERLDLKKVSDLEIDPSFLVMTGKSCFLRTIPYLGNLLVFCNLQNPLEPKRLFTFDAGNLVYFTANEKYLAYSIFEDGDKQDKNYSLTVLKTTPESPPELIGSISVQDLSTFEVIDNAIYVFEKDGLKIYEIK